MAEVYAQIVKDLTEAIDSKALNVSKSAGDNQGFIDEWAAKALLTRVYIYMGKNQEALDIAKNIIENSPYSLWTKAQYANAWDKNNANHINEMIFELVNSGSDDWAVRIESYWFSKHIKMKRFHVLTEMEWLLCLLSPE